MSLKHTICNAAHNSVLGSKGRRVVYALRSCERDNHFIKSSIKNHTSSPLSVAKQKGMGTLANTQLIDALAASNSRLPMPLESSLRPPLFDVGAQPQTQPPPLVFEKCNYKRETQTTNGLALRQGGL